MCNSSDVDSWWLILPHDSGSHEVLRLLVCLYAISFCSFCFVRVVVQLDTALVRQWLFISVSYNISCKLAARTAVDVVALIISGSLCSCSVE